MYRLLVDQWQLTEPKETVAERNVYFYTQLSEDQGCLI